MMASADSQSTTDLKISVQQMLLKVWGYINLLHCRTIKTAFCPLQSFANPTYYPLEHFSIVFILLESASCHDIHLEVPTLFSLSLLPVEREKQRERDNIDLLIHLFMYLLVASCMYPNWRLNPQP